MTRLRIAIRDSLAGPLLALLLLWAGVAIPVMDQGRFQSPDTVLADPHAGTASFTHHHGLCLLFQATPGWASAGTPAPDAASLSEEEDLPAPLPGSPGDAPHRPTARAPPSPI